jgi:predicted small metal-binding protein
MANSQHFEHQQALITALYNHCKDTLPFSSDQASETDQAFIEQLKQLTESEKGDDDYTFRGQHLITQIIANYPHITPEVSRDLMWLLGGDCLHFMSDEEIELYQKIEEHIYEEHNQGKELTFNEAKTTIFKLH